MREPGPLLAGPMDVEDLARVANFAVVAVHGDEDRATADGVREELRGRHPQARELEALRHGEGAYRFRVAMLPR